VKKIGLPVMKKIGFIAFLRMIRLPLHVKEGRGEERFVSHAFPDRAME